MKRPQLSIVIPLYNEENRVLKSLNGLVNFVDSVDYPVEVILVDDGSTDQTGKIVKDFIASRENFRCQRIPHQGKAVGIMTGFGLARGKLLLQTDIDLAVPLSELPKFFLWITEQDFAVIIASREGIGARRVGEPYLRHLMGRVFNLLVQLLLLPGINDTQCGFKLFTAKAAEEIFSHLRLYRPDSAEIKGARLTAFDVEVLYLARFLGYKIKEVPVTWSYGAESKVHPLRDSIHNARDVFSVRLNALRGLYRS